MIKITVGRLLSALLKNNLLTTEQVTTIAYEAKLASNYEAKVRAVQELGITLMFENVDRVLLKDDIVWIPAQDIEILTKVKGCNSIW